jgi:putative membrane protein
VSDPLADDPRVALAQERTLLAWVRTGLALMGFGFVVARFGVFMQELGAARLDPITPQGHLAVVFGATLVVLGVGVNTVAALQHVRRLRMLGRGQLFSPRPHFGVAVALGLAAVGIGMAIHLLVLG